MNMRRIRIIFLCISAILPFMASPAAPAVKDDGGAYSAGLFGMNDDDAALSRIKLYDYLAPANATLGLEYWMRRDSGRYDELRVVNPGDQDHEIFFHSETDTWRLDLSENRIYHALTPQWQTRREWDSFSFKYVPPDGVRVYLALGENRRSGNLSSSQPVGQEDREGTLRLQTPAGSVSAALEVNRARMKNGADDRDRTNVSGLLAYKPGRKVSSLLSVKTGEIINRLDVAGSPDISNDSVGLDVSYRTRNGRSAHTANVRFSEISAAAADSLSRDEKVLALGTHGGDSDISWKLEYRFIDRSMSGIQTTDQEINRYEARLNAKLAWLPDGRVRAGFRFENRDAASSLSPSLKSFTEFGSEKTEAWLTTYTSAFRPGGNATLFIRAKTQDFTLAPGVNRGATGADSFNYGLTASCPAGRAALSYSYLYGKNDVTFIADWITAAGQTALEADPASDQSTHIFGLNFAYDSDTDIDLTAMYGTGRTGGLLEAGRTREKDGRLSITRRFDRERTGNLTLRANNYKDDLSTALSENSVYVEASMKKSF